MGTIPNWGQLVKGECAYCGHVGLLDARAACEQCIKDAYYREEHEAEIEAGDWDDEMEVDTDE